MARKKISPPPPPERDDDDDDLVPEPQPRVPEVDDDASSELAGILAELGGASDASISVNKVTVQGEERLGKFMPREFDVDSLRDRYGGGVYWLYFHVGGKLHTKRRVVFARTLEEQRGVEPSAARAISSTSGDLFERQAQQQREMLQMVIQLVTSTRPPTTDPMMVISAAIASAEKLANLGSRKGEGDDLERLLRLHKLVRELGDGGGGEGSGLAGAAMEFMRLMREQAPTAPTAQLPAPPGAQPGDPQQMMILVRRALAERLPMLIRGAQSETDPGVYAQLVLDQVPQPFIAPLLEQLQKPEWFNVLVQIDGRVVPHQAWFEALRNEILQATSQDQPPES